MRLAFTGPPGASKSTQAKVVAQIDSEREMQGYHERGKPVPGEEILPVVLPRVRRAGGWMLDNFPASVARGRALEGERGASEEVG